MIKLRRALGWACAILLAAAFVGIGLSKLGGPSALRWATRFEHWGYPASARYLVGALEILGGAGLLIPKWRRAAGAILVTLMIGAAGTHAVHGEFPRLIPPLVLGAIALLVSFTLPKAGRRSSI